MRFKVRRFDTDTVFFPKYRGWYLYHFGYICLPSLWARPKDLLKNVTRHLIWAKVKKTMMEYTDSHLKTVKLDTLCEASLFGWLIQTPQRGIPQSRNKWAELMISTETCQIPMVPYNKGTHGASEWPRQLKHTGQHPRQEATQMEMALGTSKVCTWVISFVLLSTRMGRNEEQVKPTEMSLGTVLRVTATLIPMASLENG